MLVVIIRLSQEKTQKKKNIQIPQKCHVPKKSYCRPTQRISVFQHVCLQKGNVHKTHEQVQKNSTFRSTFSSYEKGKSPPQEKTIRGPLN